MGCLRHVQADFGNSSIHLCRLEIGLERCRMSVQYIKTLCHDTLPLVRLTNHPSEQLNSSSLLYIKVPLQESLYVVRILYPQGAHWLRIHGSVAKQFLVDKATSECTD